MEYRKPGYLVFTLITREINIDACIFSACLKHIEIKNKVTLSTVSKSVTKCCFTQNCWRKFAVTFVTLRQSLQNFARLPDSISSIILVQYVFRKSRPHRTGTPFFKDAYFLPFCAQIDSGLVKCSSPVLWISYAQYSEENNTIHSLTNVNTGRG